MLHYMIKKRMTLWYRLVICIIMSIHSSYACVVDHVGAHIKLLYTIDLHYKSLSYLPKSTLKHQSILDCPFKESFFKSPIVQQCVSSIERSHTIIPLFNMWDEFITYGLSSQQDEEQFIHECCRLVFIIYNKSLCYASADEYTILRVDISEVRDLYVSIANLPIARLLNILDEVAQGLTNVITLHNKSAPEGGYFGWMQNNWWIPPTVLAGIVTAIVLGKKTSIL